MVSAEGAAYCDFCKEPFGKKKERPRPPAAAPDPLAKIPPEKLLEMSDELLKSDAPPQPNVPPWLRPLAWTFLALCLAVSAAALWMLHARYEERRQEAPPAGAPTLP